MPTIDVFEEADNDYPSPVMAWAIVALLFFGYIFSFVDRMIIGLLVEPIKADLQISDLEFSLLVGMAFALFYTIAGIPIGRIVDNGRRMRIIACGVALWSVMTALCAFANSFLHLFVARMGVGVGEATLSPAAYSIISDSFPQRRMGLAISIYGLGAAIGAGMAFMLGAVILDLVSSTEGIDVPLLGNLRIWQAAFLIVGLPGLVLAAIFLFLPEPSRIDEHTDAASRSISLRDVLAFVRSRWALLRDVILAASFINLGLQGAIAWLPALLMRVHGMSIATAGYVAGSALIIGGLIGLIGGGALTDRLAGGSPESRLWLSGIATAVGALCGLGFPLVPSVGLLWFLFAAFFAAAAVTIGTVPTVLQQIVPNRMRATVSAGYLFAISIIGLGLGPTMVALAGDLFFSWDGGIRYALAIICPLSFGLGALFYARSVRGLRNLR